MADPRLRRCRQCNLKFVWMNFLDMICPICRRIKEKEIDKQLIDEHKAYDDNMYKYVKRERISSS